MNLEMIVMAFLVPALRPLLERLMFALQSVLDSFVVFGG